MFDTYFDDSLRFGAIMVEKPMILLGTILFNLLSIVLSIAAILMLGLSWVDVGFGLLATMAIGLVVGVVYSMINAVNQRFTEWTVDHLGLATFIGALSTVAYATLGLALFVGLPAAFVVVVAPVLITSPMMWAYRSWALRTY